MPRLPERILLVALFLCASSVTTPPPDVVLTDESGHIVHFYGDLVKGNVVAVNFIFTTCTTICQPMSATFAKAETLLADRPNARLVSISIDPETDTPRRLAAWKKRFSGGARWTLLTGSKEDVDRLRKALGVFTPDRINHTPTVVIIDDVHGRTTRVNGLVSARAIVSAMEVPR